MPDAEHSLPEYDVARDGVCYMCTVCCPTKIHVRNVRAVQIDIVDESVADTCPRWKAQLDFVYHPERLRQPLKRVGERGVGAFVPITWDEALDITASNLQKIKTEYGAESVVFYFSFPKEPRPYFHRLAHAFGSPNYCTESSNCFTASWLAAFLTLGNDYKSLGSYSRVVDPATKCELAWSSAVRHSSPWVWKDYLVAKQKGLKLIVVDPRRTNVASMADIHLQLRPGTDGALALGLMHMIINEQLYDKEFVERWTIGFDALKALVQEYPPERVEAITRVPATKVREAAILYATQKPARIRMSPGATTHHHNGVQNHRAVILLAALTGNLEVPGGNQTGPVAVPTNNITLHERVADLPPGLGSDKFPIWTKAIAEMQANTIADRIESAKPYPIKALFGAGINIMFFPNSNRLLENLKKLEFMVVTEYFNTPGTQLADIVLPVASWIERQMLVTTPEGRLRLVEPAIEPVGESWPEWKIISELANRLGLGNEFWGGDFEQCLRYVLEPSGITLEDLKRHPEGIESPVAPTSTRCYEQVGFQTPSGKVEITSSILAQHGHDALPVYKEPVESPLSRPDLASSFPLVLTSGARTVAFTHSQYRNIAQLRRIVPEHLLEINPADAKLRGIQSGDMVTVNSPRGSIKLRADVTDTILAGVVHIPHHWPGDANVNILVDDQTLDPISGFALFKSQLCQVTKS